MRKFTPLFVGAVAFVYYAVLSAKQWTWVFVSGDSGDWLATSNWWMVPQPVGSPLYITLARLIGFFADGDVTVIAMTILLSCLPSAITVMLAFLIVHKLTQRYLPSVASSIVLLGAGVFLSQSTVVEEYALAVMFLTLAFYFYILGKKGLYALSLGLGTAVHALLIPIVLVWFVIALREDKWQLGTMTRPLATFLVFGILPYTMILVLMWLDTPRLLAGGLNTQSLNEYFLGSGSIIGNLSVFEVPVRTLTVSSVLLMSLGFAFIPLWYGLKRPYDTKKIMLVCTLVFALWIYFTNIDPSTWTFLCFGMPSTAILCGIGLSKLELRHTYVVVVCALALIVTNGLFLNANMLTREDPRATTYYDELMSLEDGSVVVTAAGEYSLGLFYVMSEGKNLTPMVHPYMTEAWEFDDHKTYIREKFGLEGDDMLGFVQDALDKDVCVYFACNRQKHPPIQDCFLLEDGNTLRPVVGLSGVTIEEILYHD